MSSHAEICPVCGGSGKKQQSEDGYTTTSFTPKTCHGCGGLGWVTVCGVEIHEGDVVRNDIDEWSGVVIFKDGALVIEDKVGLRQLKTTDVVIGNVKEEPK